MTHNIPFVMRAVIFAIIGTGLVSGWLQPTYEMFIVGGGVYVPNWWVYLHVASLAALIFLSIYLRKRDRRLCIICWCAFWISLVSDVMPGYA
jgi:hypothetical protein